MANFYHSVFDSKRTLFKCFMGMVFLFHSLDSSCQYQWTKTFGNELYCYPRGVKVDSAGNTYSFGTVQGTVDVDPSSAVQNITGTTYILKLDSAGNFVWVRELSSSVGIGCLEIDNNGDLLMTGVFSGSQDFDFGPGQYTLGGDIPGNIFVLKINANADFIWAKSYGGIGIDGGSRIRYDSSNNVIVTGVFGYTVNFNPGAGNETITTNYYTTGFCLKLTAAGNFVWVKNIAGSYTYVLDSRIDSQGNILLCGKRSDPNITNPTTNNSDGYIKKISPQGTDIWEYALSGSSNDTVDFIDLDSNDNLIAVGSATAGLDFNPSAQVNTLSSNAYQFVLKLDSGGNFTWLKGIQTTSIEDLRVDSNNNIYLLGRVNGQFYYVPDQQTFTPCFNSNSSEYLIRLTSDGGYNWGFYQKNNTNTNTKSRLDITGTNMYLVSNFSGNADFNPTGGHDYATGLSSSSIYLSKFSTVNLSVPEFWKTTMKLLSNPADEALYLSFDHDGSKQLGIYAIDGKKISQQLIQGDYAALDVAGLASGIYLITCQSDFGTVTEKFVKR